jgi:hypothetical protein
MAEINKFSKEYIGEDSIIDILLRMDYRDLLKMCKTSKEFNSICKRDTFWVMKGKYDFGETYSNNYKSYKLSPKEIYFLLYKHIDLIDFNDFLVRLALNNIANILKIYLQLSDLKKLFSIDQPTFDFFNTNELFMSHLSINELPSTIGLLRNLETLYLIDCGITSLPKEIRYLTKLKNLFLYDNKLTNLPNEICLLTNLKFISLSFNNLTSLPDCLDNLTKLSELEIVGNQISELPQVIDRLNARIRSSIIKQIKTQQNYGERMFNI